MDPMSNLALLGADTRSSAGAGNSAKAPESLLPGLSGGNAADSGAVGTTLSDLDAGQTFVISFQEVIDALASGKGLPAGGNGLPPAVEGLPVAAAIGDDPGTETGGLAGLPRAELLQWLAQRLQEELPPAELSAARAGGDPAAAAALAPLVQQLLAAGGVKLEGGPQAGALGESVSPLPLDLPELAPAAERASRPSSPVASAVHQVLFAGEALEIETAAETPELPPVLPRAPVAVPSAIQQALAAVGVRLPEPSAEAPVAGPALAGPVAAAGLSAATPAATALRPEFTVAEQVGGERWAQAVGERVMMLVGRDQHMAELKLSPPNLGPLEVRVSVQQDQASVAFVAQHAAVRDALEQAIPRLREMLAQQDLQLVNVDVSQREAGQQAASGDANRGRSGGGGGGVAEDGSSMAPSGMQPARVLQGMVDLFA